MISIPRFRLITLLALLVCVALAAVAQEAPPGEGVAGARGVRGTVISISGNTVNIKTEEGENYKVETGVNTRMMKDREPAKIADVHVGDMVIAGGEVDAKAKTVGAVFVAILDPEQVKKMRADLGKTWLAGSVTSIQDTNISVKRIDGVQQTFAVDENTSFKKHRDSVTLADIHTGDMVTARGALKDGVFVATIVNVGRMGEGRPGAIGGGPAPGGPPAPPQQ